MADFQNINRLSGGEVGRLASQSAPDAAAVRQDPRQPAAGTDLQSKTTQEKQATAETRETKMQQTQSKGADNVRFSQDMTPQYTYQRRSAIIQRHFREEIEKNYLSFLSLEPTREELQLAARYASSSIWDILKKARKDDDKDDVATEMLACLLKMHSEYTFEHSERVSEWTVALAEEMGIQDEEELENLENAAFFKDIGMLGESVDQEDQSVRDKMSEFLKNSKNFFLECSSLHDIGKMSIPKEIINKTAPLNDEEFAIIKTHPIIGAEILKNIPILRKAIPGVKHHHEKYDGSGYPDGLKGDNIPLAARIITVTDSFDAMIEDRPYRKALSPSDAINELLRLAGKQFDPVLVKPFIRTLIKKEFITPDELNLDIDLNAR